jgi:CheY-like chemotaxis protein
MARILVVEDETNIRKFVAVNLAQRGHVVNEAKDAGEALAQLRAARPDLLVLDIKLPDLTGWELLLKIAQDPSVATNFPVLVMTASPTGGHITDRERYGTVVEILLKPFSTTTLIEAVERALGPAVFTRST